MDAQLRSGFNGCKCCLHRIALNFPYLDMPLDPQREKFEAARFELHSLLSNPVLAGIPLLVVRLSLIQSDSAFVPYGPR